jgi:hypothetical protein
MEHFCALGPPLAGYFYEIAKDILAPLYGWR